MTITYVLLSPTFGMHQYTADLANRANQWSGVGGQGSVVRGQGAGAESPTADRTVRLITTTTLPRDRYSPAVQIITPLTAHGTGFSREGLDFAAYRRVLTALAPEASSSQPEPVTPEHRPSYIAHSTFHIPHSTSHIPHSTFHIPHPTSHIPHPTSHIPHSTSHIPHSTFHFTGVHLWNLPLVYELRRRGIPVVHTLHDLDPHRGVRFGGLIRLWNRLIIASGCHLLVHGQRYRDQLLAQGVPPDRITYAPLLHGFLSASRPWPPQETGVRHQTSGARGQESGDRGQAAGDGGQAAGDRGQAAGDRGQETSYIVDRTSHIAHSTFHVPHPTSTVMFFGRIEAYKGVDILLAAWSLLTKELRNNSCNSWPELRLILAGPIAPGVTLPPLPADVELRDRRIMDDEADALFCSADLLVLPYRDATQSALVAAAYAYGLPVIVTRTGALAEYVVEGETGWIVPPEDPAALAHALRNALADPDRTHNMGAAGRAWFEARRREEEAVLAEMYNHRLHA